VKTAVFLLMSAEDELMTPRIPTAAGELADLSVSVMSQLDRTDLVLWRVSQRYRGRDRLAGSHDRRTGNRDYRTAGRMNRG
jgi:hypothetical protein